MFETWTVFDKKRMKTSISAGKENNEFSSWSYENFRTFQGELMITPFNQSDWLSISKYPLISKIDKKSTKNLFTQSITDCELGWQNTI